MQPVTVKDLEAARAISTDPVLHKRYLTISILSEPTVITRTEAQAEELAAAVSAALGFLPGAPGFRTFF